MNNIHLNIIGSKTFFSLLDELNLNYKITFDENLKFKSDIFIVRIIFIQE